MFPFSLKVQDDFPLSPTSAFMRQSLMNLELRIKRNALIFQF